MALKKIDKGPFLMVEHMDYTKKGLKVDIENQRPFRVGRKKGNVVLTKDGIHVVSFPQGADKWALKFVELLNKDR